MVSYGISPSAMIRSNPYKTKIPAKPAIGMAVAREYNDAQKPPNGNDHALASVDIVLDFSQLVLR